MARMSNKDLQMAYATLNERFFDNRLDPEVKVLFDNELYDDGGEGEFCKSERTIRIDSGLRKYPDYATATLLHEMVHVEYPNHVSYENDSGHGMVFKARIVDLFNRGAYDGIL
jgi:hypothetical protein